MYRTFTQRQKVGVAAESGLLIDAEAVVANYIRSTSLPTTFLYTSHAYSDFLYLNHFTKDQSSSNPNRYLLTIPVPDDTILPGFALEQTGEFVLAALKSPKKYIGMSTSPFWYRVI